MEAPPRAKEDEGRTRLVYLAPKDVLIARVARKCMMHLCEALTLCGAQVELISMDVKTVESEPTNTRSLWDVYGIENPFRITTVPTILDQRHLERLVPRLTTQVIRLFAYPLYALRAHLRRGQNVPRPSRTVFYSRNYACALGVMPLRKLLRNRSRVVLEVHVPPKGRLQRMILSMVDGAACQSLALRDALVKDGTLDPETSVGRHGGWSPQSNARLDLDKSEARKVLGWKPSESVACYTGKVHWGFQEVELMLQMARSLESKGVRVVIVGGRADHADMWRSEAADRGIGNVVFTGFVAPSDVILYQAAADVLVSYYPSGNRLNDFRSPGKIFEYMSSGTPAVVADYLSIHEVIRDSENGLIVPPNKPALLAEAVLRLLNDKALADRLATQARVDVDSFTWAATAETTLALVDRLWKGTT